MRKTEISKEEMLMKVCELEEIVNEFFKSDALVMKNIYTTLKEIFDQLELSLNEWKQSLEDRLYTEIHKNEMAAYKSISMQIGELNSLVVGIKFARTDL